MKIRTQLLVAFSALVAVTLGVSFLLIATKGRRIMADAVKGQAEAVKDMFTAATAFGANMGERTEELVGSQMIVQATILAHLVDVAENAAGLSAQEINARLADIAEYTVLDEVWITDENGHAYLTTHPGTEFTFPPASTRDSQAAAFTPLLTQERGQVSQETTARDLGKGTGQEKWFKYAGVSGIDKPRIVQVGLRAESLAKLREGLRPAELGQTLADAANVLMVQYVLEDGAVAMEFEPGRKLRFYSNKIIEDPGLLRDIDMALADDRSVTRMARSHLCVTSPVVVDGDRLAMVIMFDPKDANEVIAFAMRFMAGTFVVMLALGLLLSVRISRGIASPLQRLAEEAEEIGRGNLDRRIDVETGGTVGVLVDSFNRMIASLNAHIDELRETTAARQTLETEVAVAADLQRSMLPKRTPQRPELDLAAHTRPARVVGGDLYDFVERPGGRLGLAIADASGKGLSAALYLSQCRSVLRTLAMESDSAETVVKRGNEIILSTCECEGRFLTFLYAMYDPGTHEFTFVNAGHMAPLVVRKGRLLADFRDEGTLPMAIQPDIDTTEHIVQLEHGDVVVLYTDGITDARNEAGELFGLERLIEVVESSWGGSSRETIRRIRQATVAFAGDREPDDDLTLVVLRVTG